MSPWEKKKGLFACLKWWSSSSWAPRRTVNDVCFSFDHLRETKYIRRQPNQTSVWFLSSHFCSGDAKRKTTDFHYFGIYVTWLLPLQGKNMEASGVDARTSEEQKTCSAPENTKFICPNVKCLVNGTTRPKTLLTRCNVQGLTGDKTLEMLCNIIKTIKGPFLLLITKFNT